MKIEKNCAVTLRYKVCDIAGKVLEQSSEPLAYLHGGYGSLFPKVEQALEELRKQCLFVEHLGSYPKAR